MKVKIKSNNLSVVDLQVKLSNHGIDNTVVMNYGKDNELSVDVRSFNDLQTLIDATDCKLIISRNLIVVDDAYVN